MLIRTILLAVVVSATSAAVVTDGADITVWVQNYAEVPDTVLSRAMATATRVLATAGVNAAWLDCPRECTRPFTNRDFLVRIHSRSSTPEGAIGEAFLSDRGGFSVAASVYYDQFEALVERTVHTSTDKVLRTYLPFPDPRATVLGNVIAHELRHLLLGPGSHSTDGIMQPAWTDTCLADALAGRLHFTSDQAARIEIAVAARTRPALATEARELRRHRRFLRRLLTAPRPPWAWRDN